MKSTETLKKYRGMKEEDLVKELAKVEKDQTIASLKAKAGKLDKHTEVKSLRKDIARIKTVLNEKVSGENNG